MCNTNMYIQYIACCALSAIHSHTICTYRNETFEEQHDELHPWNSWIHSWVLQFDKQRAYHT